MAVPQIKHNPLTGQILSIIANMIGSKLGRGARAEEAERGRDFATTMANTRLEEGRLADEQKQEATRLA